MSWALGVLMHIHAVGQQPRFLFALIWTRLQLINLYQLKLSPSLSFVAPSLFDEIRDSKSYAAHKSILTDSYFMGYF